MIMLHLDLPQWGNGGGLVLAMIVIGMVLTAGAERMMRHQQNEVRKSNADDVSGKGNQ